MLNCKLYCPINLSYKYDIAYRCNELFKLKYFCYKSSNFVKRPGSLNVKSFLPTIFKKKKRNIPSKKEVELECRSNKMNIMNLLQ